MGGFGSGRTGGRVTIERTASFVLSTSMLTRRGLRPGFLGTVIVSWRDPRTEQDSLVGMIVNAREPRHAFVEFVHNTRTLPPEAMHYRARLLTTTPHFGGTRWWFACPRTGRRVAKLYLPSGGRQFWSRQAYALAYQSQREQRHDRARQKAQSIREKLGGPQYGNLTLPFPPKPKGMWWRTYERLRRKAAAAETVSDQRLFLLAEKLLGKPIGVSSKKGFWE